MGRFRLTLLFAVLLVLAAAVIEAEAIQGKATKKNPPAKPLQKSALSERVLRSTKKPTMTEREQHHHEEHTIHVALPKDEEKYAEAEKQIKEAWAHNDTFEPHLLDPNHPSLRSQETGGHDPLMDQQDRAPLPPNDYEKDAKDQGHRATSEEERDYALAVEDINALNKTSLHAALHDFGDDGKLETSYYFLFGYRKDKNCETCARHLAEFIDICGAALAAERGIAKHNRRFRCGYFDMDQAKPKDLRKLHSMEPHFSWHVPFTLALDLKESNSGAQHGKVLEMRRDHFVHDLRHHMLRYKHNTDVSHILGEHMLLDLIFHSDSDGVVIVAFHDQTTADQTEGKGRFHDYFERVSREENHHIHFAFAQMAPPAQSEGEEYPVPHNLDWIEEYNPDHADIVAYIASPDGKHFRTASMNISHCDGEWDNFHGVLEIREFVDEIKGYRHGSRRFRGIKNIRHYEVVDDDAYVDKVLVESGEYQNSSWTQCPVSVEEGDEITVSVVGKTIEHDEVFLNWTNKKIVVGQTEGLPPAAQHVFVGMCNSQQKEVYIPAHHGFHSEHYHITVTGFQRLEELEAKHQGEKAAKHHEDDTDITDIYTEDELAEMRAQTEAGVVMKDESVEKVQDSEL